MITVSDISSEFEKTFQAITSIIFGKKLSGYNDYSEWLSRDVLSQEETKSVLSGKSIYLPLFNFYPKLKSKLVTITEAYDVLGKQQISEQNLERLSFSNAAIILRDISTTTMDTEYGTNTNVSESSLYYSSHTCLRGVGLNRSKCAMYCFWPRFSEYALGCYYLFSSQFCIRCFNSENLTRCFEMSDCNNCSDSMFCHNSENLKNCMFCFNTKSKQYAICNVEIGREKYLEIRKLVMDQMIGVLEKEKTLKLSIFNLSQK